MTKIKAMDLAVISVFTLLIAFTVAMIITFYKCYAIPDTLCTCVYGCLGCEYGALAWIKTTKERRQDHEWQKEDYKQYREEQREQMKDPVPPVEEIKMEENNNGIHSEDCVHTEPNPECVDGDCSAGQADS